MKLHALYLFLRYSNKYECQTSLRVPSQAENYYNMYGCLGTKYRFTLGLDVRTKLLEASIGYPRPHFVMKMDHNNSLRIRSFNPYAYVERDHEFGFCMEPFTYNVKRSLPKFHSTVHVPTAQSHERKGFWMTVSTVGSKFGRVACLPYKQQEYRSTRALVNWLERGSVKAAQCDPQVDDQELRSSESDEEKSTIHETTQTLLSSWYQWGLLT